MNDMKTQGKVVKMHGAKVAPFKMTRNSWGVYLLVAGLIVFAFTIVWSFFSASIPANIRTHWLFVVSSLPIGAGVGVFASRFARNASQWYLRSLALFHLEAFLTYMMQKDEGFEEFVIQQSQEFVKGAMTVVPEKR